MPRPSSTAPSIRFPLQVIPSDTRIDFMGKRWIAFSLSILLTVASILLIFTKGLNLGIDFTGGIIMEIHTEQPADLGKLRQTLAPLELGEVALQQIGADQKQVIIRIQASEHQDQAAMIGKVKQALAATIIGGLEYRQIDYVGPQVGNELIRDGVIAMILAFLAMLVYIWFRFEWQYGIGGISALLHDTIVALGFISLIGVEFNLTTVAALLTIIGYSINDSVVIYDRIRENNRKYKSMPLEQRLNRSINETLSRTILTAGCTVLAALALLLLGGDVLYSFSVTMTFGLLLGTFSSIYISAPVLIYLKLPTTAGAEKERP